MQLNKPTNEFNNNKMIMNKLIRNIIYLDSNKNVCIEID